jgi:hypothetical protein
MDSSFVTTDMFGRETKIDLKKGQYACPVFSTKKEAVEHADNRFKILKVIASENKAK